MKMKNTEMTHKQSDEFFEWLSTWKWPTKRVAWEREGYKDRVLFFTKKPKNQKDKRILEL